MRPLFPLFALLLLAAGCARVDHLTMFHMDYALFFTIPSGTIVDLPFDLVSPETETESEQTFEQHDTRADLVEEVHLEDATIKLVSPDNGNLDFLESLKVYLLVDGQPEILLAWRDVVPEGVDSMALSTAKDDLTPYLTAEEFRLRIQTVTDEVLTENHDFRCDTRFFVDAEVLGI